MKPTPSPTGANGTADPGNPAANGTPMTVVVVQPVPTPSALAELPVLPLLGSAAVEVPLPPSWESIRLPAQKLNEEIGGLLNNRVEQLLRLLKNNIPSGSWWLRSGYDWFVKPKLRDQAQNWVLNFLRQDLDGAGLLAPPLADTPPPKKHWWSF